MKTLNDRIKEYISQSVWRNLYCSFIDDDIRAAEKMAFMAGYNSTVMSDEEIDEMYNDIVLNKKEN